MAYYRKFKEGIREDIFDILVNICQLLYITHNNMIRHFNFCIYLVLPHKSNILPFSVHKHKPNKCSYYSSLDKHVDCGFALS